MSSNRVSRRGLLKSIGFVSLGSLAGCTAPIGDQIFEGTPNQGSSATPRPSPGDPSSTNSPDSGSAVTPTPESVFRRVYRSAIDSVILLQVFVSGDVGTGSGFSFGSPRRLLTNQHVVANADHIEVRFSQGEWRTGRVQASDVYSDLAVVEIDDPPSYVTPLRLIDGRPTIGQEVIALGSPFGLEKSLTTGVVSGIGRSIPTQGGFSIPDAVQTDAAVNPGNSGGPLMTLDRRVVGIVRSGGGQNIGFAVSASLIREIVPVLIEEGEYEHSFMGVTLTDVTPTIASANRIESVTGVLVVDILNEGPSMGVLRESQTERTINGVSVPVGGDVIQALEDQPIRTLAELSRFLALETRPEQTITVTVIRNGRRQQVDLTLGRRPPP